MRLKRSNNKNSKNLVRQIVNKRKRVKTWLWNKSKWPKKASCKIGTPYVTPRIQWDCSSLNWLASWGDGRPCYDGRILGVTFCWRPRVGSSGRQNAKENHNKQTNSQRRATTQSMGFSSEIAFFKVIGLKSRETLIKLICFYHAF
jgi:hypothetical protein